MTLVNTGEFLQSVPDEKSTSIPTPFQELIIPTVFEALLFQKGSLPPLAARDQTSRSIYAVPRRKSAFFNLSRPEQC